ncbi:hypothetical protein [Metabacillus fastidiosus]|uniref:hypothetical protein n=1 Tax=Metabacillus fastidiosus TaxID=1458 RepID=UPI002DB6F12B|nr:hypothetical protein [Metabacillus fastidiosus]MEC2074585.1 hypothetical protein [Metabacillus fastidiosus]
MKIHNSLRKVIFRIGFVLFASIFLSRFDPLDYNLFVPNQTLAFLYIGIGMVFLLSSNFFKKPRNSKNY